MYQHAGIAHDGWELLPSLRQVQCVRIGEYTERWKCIPVLNDTEKAFDKTQNSMTPYQEKKKKTQNKKEKEKHTDINKKAYENM